MFERSFPVFGSPVHRNWWSESSSIKLSSLHAVSEERAPVSAGSGWGMPFSWWGRVNGFEVMLCGNKNFWKKHFFLWHPQESGYTSSVQVAADLLPAWKGCHFLSPMRGLSKGVAGWLYSTFLLSFPGAPGREPEITCSGCFFYGDNVSHCTGLLFSRKSKLCVFPGCCSLKVIMKNIS